MIRTKKDCNSKNRGSIALSEIIEGGNVIVALSERALGRITASDIKNPISGETIIKKGEMIDEATAKIALMRVSKAYLAGLVDKDYLDSMAEKSKSITGYDILGNN